MTQIYTSVFIWLLSLNVFILVLFCNRSPVDPQNQMWIKTKRQIKNTFLYIFYIWVSTFTLNLIFGAINWVFFFLFLLSHQLLIHLFLIFGSFSPSYGKLTPTKQEFLNYYTCSLHLNLMYQTLKMPLTFSHSRP